MLGRPETQYARSQDGTHIAYQAFGDGPLDLVLIAGWVSHLDAIWEYPPHARWLRRLGSFARVIALDKRGTGLSDRMAGAATIEQRADDLLAVMDSVGSEQAAIACWYEAVPMALCFAASHPERTRALVLGAAYARWRESEDFEWGVSAERLAFMSKAIESGIWGQGVITQSQAPSMASDQQFLAWSRQLERLSASPGTAADLLRANFEIDVRAIVPSVNVPVLILHRTDDIAGSRGASLWLAGQMPNARYCELEGRDTLPFIGDQDSVLDEIERFLTGELHPGDPDSVVASVLFTDIADSTDLASRLGDQAWRSALDRHDEVIREAVERFDGLEVNTTGDGFVVAFDGPVRAVGCARAAIEALTAEGIAIRAGIHTGECTRRGQDFSGLTVHIAARIGALATPGEVLVSETVSDLAVGAGLTFEPRGEHSLKGVPGSWRVFAALG